MNDDFDFYRSLEDRFYAAREVIRTLRRQYLPIIDPLRKLFPGAAVFDVGCGRGEWLELMLEAGFAPQGMDLDQGMLSACAELGLPATQGDAIAYLGSLADESQALITAFHVVEHVPFEQLRSLVANALRVLKPGGLLIMETPNPENLVVATHSFYLDPTHHRPLPAPLLAFVAEHAGFSRVASLRLQEAARMREGGTPSLHEVLAGVSPDFAVVAQKGGLAPEQAAQFDATFKSARGVGLAELAERYDAGLTARIRAAAGELGARLDTQDAAMRELAETVLANLSGRSESISVRFAEQRAALMQAAQQLSAEGALAHFAALEARFDALQADVRRSASIMEVLAAELRSRLDADGTDATQSRRAAMAQLAALQAERDVLRASWSWRVTAPLRWATRPFMERATRTRAPSPAGVPTVLRPLVAVMKQVLRDPQRSYRLNQRLMRYPGLHKWLVGLSKRADIYPGPSSTARFRDRSRPHASARTTLGHVSAATPSGDRHATGGFDATIDGAARPSVLARSLVLTGKEPAEALEELRHRVLASSEAATLYQRAVSAAADSDRGRVE